MKISFFGASITQQKEGYVHEFKLKYPEFEIKQFGYGGQHISNAGIIHINEVLFSKPNYVFIDWLSTAFIIQNMNSPKHICKYIDTLIYKFIDNQIIPIFLILPNKQFCYNDILTVLKNYLQNYNIPVIDIFNSFDNVNFNEICYDKIHTTSYGSKKYADLIGLEFFEKYYNKIEMPKKYEIDTKYCNIKYIDLEYIIQKQLILTGKCEVITISQTFGPHTGMINFNGIIKNQWDRWCHYERSVFNLDFEVNNIFAIDVLQDDFDRSECKHPTDWSVKKTLNVKKIFFVEDSLEVKYIE